MVDTFTPQSTPTWNSTGFLRFSWRVAGSASISYSAPGMPDQASATVTLGFDCSYSSVAGAACGPCASPDFASAPPELVSSKHLLCAMIAVTGDGP